MNEKALEAGWRALSADLDQQWPLPLDEDGWTAKGGSLDMKQAAITTIEAYLAALPDEDGLVEALRAQAATGTVVYWKGDLLLDAADALEAAMRQRTMGRLTRQRPAMTDEMIKEAVARALAQCDGFTPLMYKALPDGFSAKTGSVASKRRYRDEAHTAITAHKKSLAKAGLGIRPRDATQEMANAGWSALAIAAGDPQAAPWPVWQAMWDKHPDKPDG